MDIQETNRRVIEQFRSGGEIEGMHRDRLVLLTTIGAKTGKPRTAPMMFQPDGDRIVVVAANAGAPTNPSWYANLVADPEVTVEVGEERYRAKAEPLEGDERERVWKTLTADFPFFADYQQKAGRTIPLVALTKVA